LDELTEEPTTTSTNGQLGKILDEELSKVISSAVAMLPTLQREALILFEYEELSLAEVAEIVGADVGTVKGRLHRARHRLKKELAPYFNENREIVATERI
jgi:RNA polymerase sigma factor (sigma-70 family)